MAWVALADFANVRWDWYSVPEDGVVEFSGLAGYSSPEHNLYALVLLEGTQAATLDWLRVGRHPLPAAVLGTDVHSGLAPLTVNFDAGASSCTAPAVITKFEFDFGAGFEDYALAPAATHVYTAAGVYDAAVRVTDSLGATHTAVVQVESYGYSEVENNDSRFELQPLPAFPFTGFRGSLGYNLSDPENYPGLDGDSADYFGPFDLEPGDKVDFIVEDLDSGREYPVELYIIDSGGSSAQGVTGYIDEYNGVTRRIWTYDPQREPDPGPYCIYLTRVSGRYGDYLLSGTLNAPFTALSATPPNGAPGVLVQLDASASTDNAPGHIASYEFDPEGDGTFTAPQAGPLYSHTYAAPGLYLASVRATDDEGQSFAVKTPVLVGGYGEAEPNDYASPMTLPAAPFAGFTGSCASGPGYPGYDGSDADWYWLDVEYGEAVKITLKYFNLDTGRGKDFQLYIQGGSLPVYATGVDNYCEVIYIPTMFDVGPFRLMVNEHEGYGYGDYSLSIDKYAVTP